MSQTFNRHIKHINSTKAVLSSETHPLRLKKDQYAIQLDDTQVEGLDVWRVSFRNSIGAEGEYLELSTVSDREGKNIFWGKDSGSSIDDSLGLYNTSIGYESLKLITTGQKNIAIGSGAGSTVVDGSGNILIGIDAGSSLPSDASNKLIISSSTGVPLISGDFDQKSLDLSIDYLTIENGSVIRVGNDDGTGGLWITNDLNPLLPNNGSRISILDNTVQILGGGGNGIGADIQVSTGNIFMSAGVGSSAGGLLLNRDNTNIEHHVADSHPDNSHLFLTDASVDILGNTSIDGTLSLIVSGDGTTINEFSTDGTLAGDSDDAVPTEKAVKTYVDAQVSGSVGTLQAVTDSGNTTSNMIDITGGEQLNVGAPLTGLKIADGSMITLGAGDGTGTVWITNDENPDNPNGGTRISMAVDSTWITAGDMTSSEWSDTQVSTGSVITTSKSADGGSSIIANPTGILLSVDTDGPDQAAILVEDKSINISITDDNVAQNVLDANLTSTVLSLDDTTLTINSTGSAFNKTLSLANGTSINEFSIDGTLSGNSDDAVPTEQAVKTYVDSHISSPGAIVQDVTTSTATVSGSTNFVFVDYSAIGTTTIIISTSWINDNIGKVLVIKDSGFNCDSQNITVETEGAQTIEGNSSYTMNSNGESISLINRNGSLFLH